MHAAKGGRTKTIAASMLFAFVIGGSTAFADQTWTFQSATFADGGTATGSFTVGPTDDLLSFNISTSGGNLVTFPPTSFRHFASGVITTVPDIPPVASLGLGILGLLGFQSLRRFRHRR